MENYDISKILISQSSYRIADILCQHWNSQSFSFRNTPRPDHGILMITRGKIEFASSTASLVAASGDMIFLPKGSRYEAIIRPEFGDTQDYLINFEIDTPLPIASPPIPFRILQTTQRKYVDLFDRLIEATFRNAPNDFSVKGYFYLLLDHIVNDCKNEPNAQKDDLLKKAEEFLSNGEDLPVSEIAKLCSVSESGLRNRFRKAYGISPLQYRIDIKIRKAKFLLESTDLSVCDIAAALNFYDEAYFCKIFRKHVGCSPKKYAMNKRI